MERMHRLADEIRETFEERGWKIDKAVQLDDAFRNTRRPQSSLGRSLVMDAIEQGCSRIGGLTSKPVCGGGRDVICIVGSAERHYRLLKASIDPETDYYDIISTSESIMDIEAETDSLFTPERWVLGYTVDDNGMVVDIFAARVFGVTDDSVGRLDIGAVTLLGTGTGGTSPGGGFQPAEENELGGGFDDTGDDAGDLGNTG